MISQKHIKDSERKFVTMMNEKGHFAQRIAGSGCGPYSVCDVVTVMNGEVFLTEVKSCKADKLPMTPETKQQLNRMIEAAQKHPPLKAMLAIHWKRRGWEMRDLDKMKLNIIGYSI